MARKRIFEYAKQNGLDSKQLVELLRQNGFVVKSHMSVLTPQMEAFLMVKMLDIATIEEEERLLVEEEKREEKERLRREEELRRRAKKRLEEEAKKRREEEEQKKVEEEKRLEEEERRKAEEEEQRKAEQKKRRRIEKLIETPEIKKIKGAAPAAKAEPPPPPKMAEPVVIEGEVEKKGKKKKKKAEPVELPRKGKRVARRRRRRAIIDIDEEDLQRTVDKTVARITLGARKRVKKKYKKKEKEEREEVSNLIVLPGPMTVRELSRKSGVSAVDILSKCLELGIIATINQKLDIDTLELVAESFGFKIEWAAPEEIALPEEEEGSEEELVPRPPVVTIMGHVDHGKTSILDFIRKSSIVAGEAGAITQHIGAYQADTPHGRITFIDTPGHEAFTAMRARGAQVTDIVVLVVAQNDGVQLQTIESINHAKAAGVPIIVAINKMDLPGANADRVVSELAKHDVLLEEIGGDVLASRVSAKTGEGIDGLLENIMLQAEMLNLRANPKRAARGVVIESRLDRGLGPIATVLVKTGTLHRGDAFVSGATSGKVRLLLNERRKPLKEAGPATPVVVTGFAELTEAGDDFFVTPSEKKAKEISLARQEARKGAAATRYKVSLEEMLKSIESGELEQFNIVLKVDTDGSAKTLSDFISSKKVEGVKLEILHAGVGNINESDILLAGASGAVVFGFNVGMEPSAKEAAKRAAVDVRIYKVIYELEEELELALSGMLKPKLVEEKLGVVEVRQVFSIPKQGKIAGCFVLDGLVRRGAKAKVRRADEIVGEGEITSLKRFKNDVKEVSVGYECGLGISGFDDFQQGDLIELYQIVEETAKTK